MKLMRIFPLHSYYTNSGHFYKQKMSKGMLTPCRGGPCALLFRLPTMLSSRASIASRGIYAPILHDTALKCVDPSTPLRFARDDMILFHKIIGRAQGPPLHSFQVIVQIIQHPLFIGGPEGRNQILLRAVAGDAVDHDMGRQFGKTPLDPGCVLLQLQALKLPF